MRLLLFFALCALCLADFDRVPPGTNVITPSNWPDYRTYVQWWTMNGKTADPCANKEELDGIRRTDCVGDEWPAPANTVLIPMVASPARTNSYPPGLVLTIRGRNMMGLDNYVNGNPVVTSRLALAKRNRNCDDIDFSLGIALATCFTTAPNAPPNCEGITFTIPNGGPVLPPAQPGNWHQNQLEAEDTPRKLCWSRQNQPVGAPALDTEWRYTGFKIGVVWDCETDAHCAAMPAAIAALNVPPYVWGDTPFQTAQRAARTKCCRHNNYNGLTPVAAGGIIQYAIGQCIDTNVQSCCQGAAIENTLERCCNVGFELVQWYHKPCACREQVNLQNNPSPSCPTGETCCIQRKYAELAAAINPPAPSQWAVWPQNMGECYNPATHRCCDTGFRYDPGQDQCCAINGIQSLNVPCPCNDHDDCRGGQRAGDDGNLSQQFRVGVADGMICCRQIWPLPQEDADAWILNPDTTQSATAYPRCSKYTNFPSGRFPDFFPIGTAPYQVQRCLGTCMDNRYQMCCNGVTCRKEYEKCCNATCCNKYTSNCIEAYSQGTPGNKWNYNELDQPYETCTTIEYLTPLKAFWLFVWPAYLLTMTVVSMAFVIAFVGKSSRRSFAFLERAMILVAFLTIILAVCCFFSTVYKYGVWLVIVSLFTVVVAAARVRYLNGILVVVQFLTLMYLFDPLNGNNYLNFSSLRTDLGLPDPQGAGVLHSIQKIFPNVDAQRAQHYCSDYYDYFAYDPQLWDYRRTNPAKVNFGYCGDGWITALLIFEGIVLMLVVVQFVLDLIAFILRFKEERSYDPIELEVRGVDEVTPMYPY